MSLISDMEAFADLLNGIQKDYWLDLLKVAQQVEVVPMSEVFTKDEIKRIKLLVRPKKKMCYNNSHQLTYLFPEKVKYVEGRMSYSGLPIDHAFNRVSDKYVDITIELALKRDVRKYEYVKFAEYDTRQIHTAALSTGYYGNYYNFYWKEAKKDDYIL